MENFDSQDRRAIRTISADFRVPRGRLQVGAGDFPDRSIPYARQDSGDARRHSTRTAGLGPTAQRGATLENHDGRRVGAGQPWRKARRQKVTVALGGEQQFVRSGDTYDRFGGLWRLSQASLDLRPWGCEGANGMARRVNWVRVRRRAWPICVDHPGLQQARLELPAAGNCGVCNGTRSDLTSSSFARVGLYAVHGEIRVLS
jgi:hypothetical protein